MGFESRAVQGGRKVERRRAVAPTNRAAWTAASSAIAHARFIPWLRARRANQGARFLFPRFAKVKDGRRTDESSHISLRAIRDRLKSLIGDEAQFHDIRRGVENALEIVHRQVAGVTEPSRETKNAIGLRSNRPLRGSRDSYVRDTIDALFDATRHLHLVEGSTPGGLLSARPQKGQEDFDTQCQRCGVDIPIGTPGALCDVFGCEWCLCIKCFPTNEELLCPRHSDAPDASSDSGDGSGEPSDTESDA